MGFVVFGCRSVFGGGWVGCGLLGGLGGGCFFFFGVFAVVFFCVGGGGLLIVCRITSILQPFSLASRGPP